MVIITNAVAAANVAVSDDSATSAARSQTLLKVYCNIVDSEQ